MMLRNQSLFFKSDSPMTRVTLLCAALEAVIWTYIKDNFYHVYGKTHARGDIEEAILQIHEANVADNSSYYASFKGYSVGFPKYHRLPDIISLFNMTDKLSGLNREFQNSIYELNRFEHHDELIMDDLKKNLKDYLEKVNEYSNTLKDIDQKLRWKTSHTSACIYTYHYTIAHPEKVITKENDTQCKLDLWGGRITKEEYKNKLILAKTESVTKSKFVTFPKGKATIHYTEVGLLGSRGNSSLAEAINENVLTNSRIKLKELTVTFKDDMRQILSEIYCSIVRVHKKRSEEAERHQQEQRALNETLLVCQADISLKDSKIMLIETQRNAAIVSVSKISDDLTGKDELVRKLELDNMQLKKEASRRQLRRPM